MAVSLRCPSCREKFPWDTAKGWPRFCAMCGTDISTKDDDAVVMPILTQCNLVVTNRSLQGVARGLS